MKIYICETVFNIIVIKNENDNFNSFSKHTINVKLNIFTIVIIIIENLYFWKWPYLPAAAVQNNLTRLMIQSKNIIA